MPTFIVKSDGPDNVFNVDRGSYNTDTAIQAAEIAIRAGTPEDKQTEAIQFTAAGLEASGVDRIVGVVIQEGTHDVTVVDIVPNPETNEWDVSPSTYEELTAAPQVQFHPGDFSDDELDGDVESVIASLLGIDPAELAAEAETADAEPVAVTA